MASDYSTNEMVLAAVVGLLLIALPPLLPLLRFLRDRLISGRESEAEKDLRLLKVWWFHVLGEEINQKTTGKGLILRRAEEENWSQERLYDTAQACQAYERADMLLHGFAFHYPWPAWRPSFRALRELREVEILIFQAEKLLRFKEICWEKVVTIDELSGPGLVDVIRRLSEQSDNKRVLLRTDGVPDTAVYGSLINKAGFQVIHAPVGHTELAADDLCLVVVDKEVILWPPRS